MIPPEVYGLTHKALKAWVAIQAGAEPTPQAVSEAIGVRLRDAQRALKELREAGLSVRIRRLDASESDVVSPSEHLTSPATTRLSTFTSTSTSPSTGTQATRQATQIVEELVKLRHIHRSIYRKRGFTLYPKARVVWMETARHLLVTDGLDLDEVLAVLNYAFTTDKWRTKIRAVYDLRQHYDQLLDEYHHDA